MRDAEKSALTLRLDFDAAAALLQPFPILEGLLRETAVGCDGQAILVSGRQDSMNIELIDIDPHSSGVADECFRLCFSPYHDACSSHASVSSVLAGHQLISG